MPDELDDAGLVRQFEQTPLAPITHRDHVRLVFLFTVEAGADAAYERVRSGLIAHTKARNTFEHFHETRTWAWARIIASAIEADGERDFDAFGKLRSRIHSHEFDAELNYRPGNRGGDTRQHRLRPQQLHGSRGLKNVIRDLRVHDRHTGDVDNDHLGLLLDDYYEPGVLDSGEARTSAIKPTLRQL